MRAHLLVCLVALIACQPKRSGPPPTANTQSPAEKLPAEIETIWELEDRRSLGEGRLVGWALTHNDPRVRARALRALGRLQLPETIDQIVKGLTDPDPAARIEAAFALGLIGYGWAPLSEADKTKLSDALKAAEPDEPDLAIRLELIAALGRVGNPASIDRLIERLSADGELAARAAIALGVACKRDAKLGIKGIAALSPLLKKEKAPNVRYGAAYALAVSKDPQARTWLLVAAQDDLPETRAIAAKGLGDVGQDTDSVTLKRLLDDPDYRVAVEATRGLAKIAGRCKGTCTALVALSDLSFRVERLVKGDTSRGGQPLLALAQQGLPPAGRPVLVALRDQLIAGVRGVADPAIRKDIANIECRISAAIDRSNGELKEVLNCGGGIIPEAQRLVLGMSELANSPAPNPARRVEDLGSYVFHSDPKVKLAAINALGASGSPTAADRLRTLLGNPDFVIAGAAANALGQLQDKQSIGPIRALAQRAMTQVDLAVPVAEALIALDAKEAVPDLQAWLQSTHANVRFQAAAALAKLGSPATLTHVERPADGVKPPNMPRESSLKVRTEKGELEIKLFTDEARLTSLNLYTLARKNYFKNLTFHRIVPDFVAQGGDPRGDGEGGPGYTIRCEVNRRPYVRGAVGIALSGKDTGGSQFFISLSPQPHLDGRYTVVGEVVKGIEVVDHLLEGDKILEIRGLP